MKHRYRARLLSRDQAELRGKLRGLRWGDRVSQNSQSDFEIDDHVFRIRVGLFVGQPRIAVISNGWFLALKAITLDGMVWPLFGINATNVLTPRKPPYGLDASWYSTFGPRVEVMAVMNSLIIEEPHETSDDTA